MTREETIKDIIDCADYCKASFCDKCAKCTFYRLAEKLIDKGYGNIKEALTEFVEKLKKNSKIHYPKFYQDGYYEVIDETLNEMLKK